MARKLAIALWRYVETGLVPSGTRLAEALEARMALERLGTLRTGPTLSQGGRALKIGRNAKKSHNISMIYARPIQSECCFLW